MSVFQLPPSRCPCKEFLISWFLPPNNLGGKKSVKFFWKCKFRVYNAVSSLGIGVRKRVTRYNWHGIKPHAVSICHFSRKAKNQLHARCHMYIYITPQGTPHKEELRETCCIIWSNEQLRWSLHICYNLFSKKGHNSFLSIISILLLS